MTIVQKKKKTHINLQQKEDAILKFKYILEQYLDFRYFLSSTEYKLLKKLFQVKNGFKQCNVLRIGKM